MTVLTHFILKIALTMTLTMKPTLTLTLIVKLTQTITASAVLQGRGRSSVVAFWSGVA